MRDYLEMVVPILLVVFMVGASNYLAQLTRAARSSNQYLLDIKSLLGEIRESQDTATDILHKRLP